MKFGDFLYLLALALVLTLANCLKPLVVDDSVYYYYSAHIADHPLDPYGFKLWGAQPANEVLAPPVLPYWWAAGMKLLGPRPFLWKAWLLPFSLLLTFSLHALCRRFTRGIELPLVTLLVLSPGILPGLNLMLDVPALALGLAALAVFCRSCERGSILLVLAAGLITGVAMQTKYTAFVVPAVLVTHGVLVQRWRLGVLAAGLAILLFTGWECFIARTYGTSHFVLALKERYEPIWTRAVLLVPLIGILGSIAPAGLVLNLAALGYSRRVVLSAFWLVALGYGLVMFVPEPYTVLIGDVARGKTYLTLNNLVFGSFGLALCVTNLSNLRKLCRSAESPPRVEYFLAAWAILEVLGYFALTPYPAVRRLLGVVVTCTILTGRLAAKSCSQQPRRALVWRAAWASAALGILFFGVDWSHYWIEKQLVLQTAQQIRERDPHSQVWYAGNGCFEFYAERVGWRRFDTAGAQLRPHDWVVAMETRCEVPNKHQAAARCTVMTRLHLNAFLPLRTFLCYYYGRTGLEHHEGPILEATIFRAH
jgi:hypothetical protein